MMYILVVLGILVIWSLVYLTKEALKYKVITIESRDISQLLDFLPVWFEKNELGQSVEISASESDYFVIISKYSWRKNSYVELVFPIGNLPLPSKMEVEAIFKSHNLTNNYIKAKVQDPDGKYVIDAIKANLHKDFSLVVKVSQEIFCSVLGLPASQTYIFCISQSFLENRWIYETLHVEVPPDAVLTVYDREKERKRLKALEGSINDGN